MSATIVKNGETTDIIVSSDTVEKLAEAYKNMYVGLLKKEFSGKWVWAERVSKMFDSIPDKKSVMAKAAELGVAVANAIGREKPYSAPWVQQHVNAYKQFPTKPDNDTDAKAFLDAVNGNSSRTAKNTNGNGTKSVKTSSEVEKTDEELGEAAYIAEIIKAVKNALKAGVNAEEIENAVTETLVGN